MLKLFPVLAARLILLLLFASGASADIVTYEGKLAVDGTPFNGLGNFKFALVGENGTTLWTSEKIALSVAAGRYGGLNASTRSVTSDGRIKWQLTEESS